MSNPLHTADQGAAEALALRLIDRADVRAARERAREALLADPVRATMDGAAGFDRALDQWTLALAMREANGDPADPKVAWNVSNPPRGWFGHVYGGAAVAVDNPDNFNREIPIAADGNYEVDIRFSADPPQFSILMEIEPDHHAGLGENLGALTLQDLLPHADADRRVRVTVGPDEGGPLHLRTRPGWQLGVYCRDSQVDWRQKPAEISVRRIDPPADWRPRDEDAIAAAVCEHLPAWITFWSGFKDMFLGVPEPNRLIGPNGRDGGWGYLAGGRFRLADDEVLLITLDPSGSYYTGFQITDPWTIAPDPMHRLASLNKSQCVANADGTVTYALAVADPGAANWIDTCGLHEGWMLARWQGVPRDAPVDRMIRGVRVVKSADLPADVPAIDLDGRKAQIAVRGRDFALRTSEKGWIDAG